MQQLITEKGYFKLQCDLNNLINVDRKKNTEEVIKLNEENTSLEENTGLKVVLEESNKIENRIKEINEILSNCTIKKIGTNKELDKVLFGSYCEIIDCDNDEKITYRIVGPSESNPCKNEISYLSPFGKLLINESVGSEINFSNGDFERNVEIIRAYYKKD